MGAARVGIAGVGRRAAELVSISDVAGWAKASSFVVEDFADGVYSAIAGRTALTVDAGFRRRTFAVASASLN